MGSSSILLVTFFIGPESDHWIPLIDVTLACEDTNSKLVEVVTFADVDEERVGNTLLQISELIFCSDFGQKVWSTF